MTLENIGVEVSDRRDLLESTDIAIPSLPEEGINLEALENHYVREAYRKAGGNDAEAAQLLKMSYYSFRYRRKKLKDLSK